MVAGALPQLNVITPAVATADCSALNVQLAAVPVPTIVAGLAMLAGCPRAGTPALHEPLGLPACRPPSEVAPDELVLLLLTPLLLLPPPSPPLFELPEELEVEPEPEPEPELEAAPELEPRPELVPEPELAAPPEEPFETPLPPLVELVPEPSPQPV